MSLSGHNELKIVLKKMWINVWARLRALEGTAFGMPQPGLFEGLAVNEKKRTDASYNLKLALETMEEILASQFPNKSFGCYTTHSRLMCALKV